MKTSRTCKSKRGFTLIELLVAMAITTIIVTVLVSITSIAIDTWNRSRSELRAARQAKAMVDSMARDFEALVVRRGNENEWLSAVSNPPEGGSTNAARLVFFTAATDRYNGEIGKTGVDLGGDVSCVGYELNWKDPIQGGTTGNFQTFVLNRYLVDPKPAFDTLLGKTEIGNLFISTYGAELAKQENFVCENVFQFTVTFGLEVTKNIGTAAAPNFKTLSIPLTLVETSGGQKVNEFRIKGSGIITDVGTVTIGGTSISAEELKGARLATVGVSITVLSDAGVDLLRKVPERADDAAWLAKNSFQYSKLIQLPGM
jgi:prepilin-type N-terminal cleavage/methylation domain-containing protein